MMKDITWGQYHSVDSMIHRLDPRVKIRFTIVYIILLLLDRNLPLFVFLTAVFAGAWACSRVPMRKMIRGTRGIFLFILICSATTPTRLTDGMEKCMHLSGGVAMGITIALRFVPILFGELDRIMKAQMARGADFKKGNPVVRLKKLRMVILPLFQNAILRAGHLGDAMDSRCYTGGKGRTKLHPLVYERRDVAAYVCMLVMTVVSVILILRF